MAVEAVFWNSGAATKAALLASLRIDQTRLDLVGDTVGAQIDAEMQAVRVGLYQALGSDRITVLLGTAYSENPSTDAAVLRLSACRAEAVWLRLNLLRTLPQLWMDSSSTQKTNWNEDAFSRERAQHAELKATISALEKELAGLLAQLSEDAEAGAGAVRVTTYPVDPCNTFWAGQTVFGRNGPSLNGGFPISAAVVEQSL